MDSGLPHDDITPRSDSLSTASSSASPPEHHTGHYHHPIHHLQHQTIREEHRKSTSLDDIQQGPQVSSAGATVAGSVASAQWKSSSLQRGMAPPTASPPPPMASTASESPIYGTVKGKGDNGGQGTVVIRTKTSRPVQSVHMDDEDPYGRSHNVRLTTFTDENQQVC